MGNFFSKEEGDMDDLGLDDMVATVNKTGDKAKKEKNAQVQMMQKIRANHSSVTKVVIRDDPIAKTAEDVFKALKTNTHIESINFNKVKITEKALVALADALKTNETLHTLILNCICPSDGFAEVIKALQGHNKTLHTLHVFQGNGKYWDSFVEKLMKDRLGDNKTIMKLVLGPIRSKDVMAFIDKLPAENKKQKKETNTDLDDDWDNLTFDYDENDKYEYVYDPDYGKGSDFTGEVGSLKGTY